MKHSPSFGQHSKCATLMKKGFDESLKNSAKYLREGVQCFAEIFGLATAIDPWRFCLARHYGDYDSCQDEFKSTFIYPLTCLLMLQSCNFVISNSAAFLD